MRNLTIVLLILLVDYSLSWSQGTDFQNSQQKTFISIAFQPSQTTILNRGVFNSSNVKNSPEVTLNGSVEIGFNLTNSLSFITGIGNRSYSTTLGMENYNNSYDSVDSEDDAYELRIVGSKIAEKQKITYLSIPVKINFQYPLSKNIYPYINLGILVSVPVSMKYSGSGLFDYNGYYPKYNITLYELPQYGFPGNVNLNKTDKLDITKYSLNFLASAGIMYKLSPGLGVSFGFFYDQSLSSISNYKPNNYHLTRKYDQYNTLMSSTSDVRLKAIGTSLSVIYYLK
jgi:hypothetical protein